jgi:hypothetical protein
VRADQVTGIDAHQTPELSGKPSHWLLDVVLPTATGSGTRGDWGLGALHRTLVQTTQPPGDAPAVLARLLAQLDDVSAAGVIVTTRRHDGTDETERDADQGVEVTATAEVRFRFTPFEPLPPGRHTGAEYL